MRPPSMLARRASMIPLWRSWPENRPTASPSMRPRLIALLIGACNSRVIPSRPRPVSWTRWPAARLTAPLGA